MDLFLGLKNFFGFFLNFFWIFFGFFLDFFGYVVRVFFVRYFVTYRCTEKKTSNARFAVMKSVIDKMTRKVWPSEGCVKWGASKMCRVYWLLVGKSVTENMQRRKKSHVLSFTRPIFRMNRIFIIIICSAMARCTTQQWMKKKTIQNTPRAHVHWLFVFSFLLSSTSLCVSTFTLASVTVLMYKNSKNEFYCVWVDHFHQFEIFVHSHQSINFQKKKYFFKKKLSI